MNFPNAQGNFLTAPPHKEFQHVPFDMDSAVPTILRLLQIDSNLARLHAKLSPHMDEVIFWRNYFLRVAYCRAAVGMDGPELQQSLGALREDEVLVDVVRVSNPDLHTGRNDSTSVHNTPEFVVRKYF